ncbi:YtxH domain-containing protein [Limosilactobacillus fermentum]|uniref:YtxH domain-containing protein n=1 Tax=Limosilactobacillus fermentum TaxID=1613 RepID=UPI000C2477D0|nr:YtxH domain-containing protein [Limosilactobacillus fermentum]MBM9560273.1 YtxH domain-containing protein [Limosilactobacillus fermentum]MDF4006611.1 YtxH domain-containing protein [Limosilactobacillus fermentum]MDF4015537.1 YtxH domain-containing protein [Limosilactobacillus fermentum]MPW02570.1 YtxH domain-containing protein [Limosilactobacillus fermentum]WJD85386.1 YtxH domain-containing protein [Limosilactobacillus fermentum]
MARKFLTGLALGSVAAVAAYKALSEEKRQALREQFQGRSKDLMDYLTEYSLLALDVVDGAVGDYQEAASDKLDNLKDTLKDQASKVGNHFTNDNFDAQTEELRQTLAQAHQAQAAPEEDIVIDQTKEQAKEPEKTAGEPLHEP